MIRTICALLLLAGAGLAGADPAQGAVGYWTSISDVKGEEGKVTALWKLSLDAQGQLQGSIVWAPDAKAGAVYRSKNPKYDGKPVMGVAWMRGLRRSGAESWTGGTIVDISNPDAQEYGCEVKVIDGGRKLAMRGYLGIALLGRTQTWLAVSEDEAKKLIATL